MAQISISNAIGSSSKAIKPPIYPPVNTEAPILNSKGIAEVGEIFYCSEGKWTGTEPFKFSYQWERNRVPIVDETNSSYTITPQDVGTQIRCLVTASNKAGISEAYSNTITPT